MTQLVTLAHLEKMNQINHLQNGLLMRGHKKPGITSRREQGRWTGGGGGYCYSKAHTELLDLTEAGCTRSDLLVPLISSSVTTGTSIGGCTVSGRVDMFDTMDEGR